MSKENIKIVQNILKANNNYELAVKLENAHYVEQVIDSDYNTH